MSADLATCKHETIAVSANTHAQLMPDGTVGARMLTVEAMCQDCKTRFWFPGLGTGLDYTKASTTSDGFALITPLVPADTRHYVDPSLVSVSIRTADALKGHTR